TLVATNSGWFSFNFFKPPSSNSPFKLRNDNPPPRREFFGLFQNINTLDDATRSTLGEFGLFMRETINHISTVDPGLDAVTPRPLKFHTGATKRLQFREDPQLNFTKQTR